MLGNESPTIDIIEEAKREAIGRREAAARVK
jgi:hypothetical protein